MGAEFELKFQADPARQDAIAAQLGNFAEIRMETVYYDTPDRALSARHITLRLRKENGKAICTVKTPEQDSFRGEWETECGSIQEAVPVLCKLGCPVALQELTAAGLEHVCGARFTRLAKTVETAACTVEIALDRGVLLGGKGQEPLCEVEVELKSGSREAAVEYARHLAEAFCLIPEKFSKFRRALRLAQEDTYGI